MLNKPFVSIYTVNCPDGVNFKEFRLQNHPSSRATRLVDDPTRFLLVNVQKTAKDKTVRESILKWQRDGITINDGCYRFLGFTESQVKAGKLMFFREDHEWTVQRLLSSFGDLQSVYLKSGYGKYSARLGLSFSSTVESMDVPHEFAIEIPDLKAPDGSLHSDGCGMIRHSFATQICSRHGLPSDTTVFQIRRGGIKGLLVRYPDEKFDELCRKHSSKSSDSDSVIAYRPSMLKYNGGPTVLELNNHNSSPAAAHVNIQFTTLLLTLGVPLEVFERLVQDQLDLIGSILTDRERAFAYIKGELDAAAEDGFLQGLYSMLLAGQDLSEPEVRARLQTFQRLQYDGLRKKMNLRIQDSCYLFGVVDEYGILGPDEVYINLPGRSGVLVRDVVVARNPSYHPGDFRKLRAVDHPTLRHHRNCIVFSSTAVHSIPDTIASGDLDGDMYFVTWDPTLIPPTESSPLNRSLSLSAGGAGSAVPSRQLDNMLADAARTFVDLRFNRLLGMMSNAWSRAVEQTPHLANSPHSLELVPKIEASLDIMKSGEDLATLEADFKRTQARHAKGENFDGFISPMQHLRDMIPQMEPGPKSVLDSTRCDPALLLGREDSSRWEHYVAEARREMRNFNRELSDAINLDKELTEGDSDSRHDREEYRNIKNADRVKQDYQRRYFGGGTQKERCEQRMRASAWYYHGYMQNKPTFAWLGEKYLNEIKACE
ncbi:RdRP-domain-containing protein, partial [Earliella scabrosa]